MTAVKQWIAFFLLMLASASASASIPLMTLILPDGQQVNLDEAALSALPQTEFTTTTPWTQGAHHYRGPTLSAVLAAQGIPDARKIAVSALVIPPFFGALKSRGHAACAKRCFGV